MFVKKITLKIATDIPFNDLPCHLPFIPKITDSDFLYSEIIIKWLGNPLPLCKQIEAALFFWEEHGIWLKGINGFLIRITSLCLISCQD